MCGPMRGGVKTRSNLMFVPISEIYAPAFYGGSFSRPITDNDSEMICHYVFLTIDAICDRQWHFEVSKNRPMTIDSFLLKSKELFSYEYKFFWSRSTLQRILPGLRSISTMSVINSKSLLSGKGPDRIHGYFSPTTGSLNRSNILKGRPSSDLSCLSVRSRHQDMSR